jgi:hypothetical protein
MKLFKSVVYLILLIGPALLLTFPFMWGVNYVFSATILTFVFGAAKIRFWQTLVLSLLLTNWGDVLKPKSEKK